MYKLLIVDDEARIRSGLRSLIEWEIYGIEIAGEAEDGMKAYLAVKSLKPDIVLVDISMPNMNGLEMIELCSHLDTPPKFIILSGYDHFEYVQKAIRLGAVNYLLKPVNQDELIHAVISCVEFLDSQAAHQEQFRESLQLLRNDILTRTLHGRIDSREFREKSHIVDINLHCSHMRAGIIHPDGKGFSSSAPIYHFLELCEDICRNFCSCYAVADTNDNIAVIFKDLTNVLKEEDFRQALSACADAIASETGLSILTALGREANHAEELALSYDDASARLETTLLLGRVVENRMEKTAFHPSVSYRDLIKTLEQRDEEHLKETLHQYFSEILSSDQGQNTDMLKYYLIELVTNILHSKYMTSCPAREIDKKKQKAFAIISGTDSILQLENSLSIFFLSLMDRSSDLVQESGFSFLIQNAISYVNENYTDDNLSLKTLAAHLEVNPAYLGREFTHATGEFFNDYLNRLRIAEAIRLLADTTWKTAKIANAVGFSNVSYFFTIFKKITGQSPGDYRSTHS